MDKEFEKFHKLSENFFPDISMPVERDPEREETWRKLDSLSSTIGSLRSALDNFLRASSDEDKALYRSIIAKYIDLFEIQWSAVCDHMAFMIKRENEEEPAVKAITIARTQEED